MGPQQFWMPGGSRRRGSTTPDTLTPCHRVVQRSEQGFPEDMQ